MDPTGPAYLGTRLRHLIELLDGDIAAVQADMGITGFRIRYSAPIRAIAARGPLSIRDLAAATGVTHSAASQTVARMAKDGLVVLDAGTDARRRMVRLTPRAEALLPKLNAEWDATARAAAALDAELPYPLSRLIEETLDALRRRPMRARVTGIAEAADDQQPPP
ncbi:MarR family transcriptional regulator [Streptomyces sp. RFCAC02]|uniref:MarR family winged helix-turn-helix transcriptional regulator n=1 Tax=Streptomyces sp. RFCAC02 TaxID=2499143 RepID=UPI001021BA1A|nr:MarR family transcriptional regulator [Streptomyces sp. RFCAC02]